MCASVVASAQPNPSTHALVIGGLGGDPLHTERFGEYIRETRRHLVERHGVPAQNIRVLAEGGIADRPYVDGISTAENVRTEFEALSRRAGTSDHVYVLMYGHGSFDGNRARLNIPREDLTDEDYARLLDDITAARVVLVNTASASGPFAARLSGPNRVIMTATATGTERDVTRFPRYFVEALGAPEADLDRDGAVSVRELLDYAASRTARSYEESGHLATEHAALDDDGDGQPTRADRLDASSADGHLAAVTYIRPPALVRSADRPLLEERMDLERAIAEVKRRKSSMSEDAYYAELETLFVRLARLNHRLDRED